MQLLFHHLIFKSCHRNLCKLGSHASLLKTTYDLNSQTKESKYNLGKEFAVHFKIFCCSFSLSLGLIHLGICTESCLEGLLPELLSDNLKAASGLTSLTR